MNGEKQPIGILDVDSFNLESLSDDQLETILSKSKVILYDRLKVKAPEIVGRMRCPSCGQEEDGFYIIAEVGVEVYKSAHFKPAVQMPRMPYVWIPARPEDTDADWGPESQCACMNNNCENYMEFGERTVRDFIDGEKKVPPAGY